jgi:hypothetical protein
MEDEMNFTYEKAIGCSGCGEINLHHGKVEVFERNEDAENGIHVTVRGMKAIVDNDLSGNPSIRRDGVKISFWCEHCDKTTVLAIFQHKGTTYYEQWVENKTSIVINDENPFETLEEIIERCKLRRKA